MGAELREQYDLLAQGAQERTRSRSVNDVDHDLQQVTETRVMSIAAHRHLGSLLAEFPEAEIDSVASIAQLSCKEYKNF